VIRTLDPLHPMRRWFLAMHFLTQAKNNVSALERSATRLPR
jgi:hypothetical protein